MQYICAVTSPRSSPSRRGRRTLCQVFSPDIELFLLKLFLDKKFCKNQVGMMWASHSALSEENLVLRSVCAVSGVFT